MTPPILDFDGVFGGYGEIVVVRGVSGRVGPGEVLGVLGRNGVGKSTLLKLLYGFLPLTEGAVRFRGTELGRLDPAQRSRSGIGYAPQERIVFDNLSVMENLLLMQRNRPLSEFGPYFERFPRLQERISQHAGTLSGGERKLLSFTRALSENKPLVLLDEPTEGVQHENVLHMAALVKAGKDKGSAFVIVEQNMGFIEDVADTYLVIDQGREVLAGPKHEISRADLIRHLGV